MNHAEVLFDGETQFGSYQVTEALYGGRRARVLYNSDRRAAQSGIPLDDPNGDMLFDYNERFMELVRGLVPKRVLVLGGAACTLPQAVLSELPNVELDIVELDKGLIDIAEGFFNFTPTANTKIHIGDAREYISKASKKYDLVIVDVFMETTIPRTLQTREAAAEYARMLTEHGVVAMNIIAAYHGQRSAVLRRQIAAWKTAFSKLELVPAHSGESLWLPQNFVLIAQNYSARTSELLRYEPLDLPKPEVEDLTHDTPD